MSSALASSKTASAATASGANEVGASSSSSSSSSSSPQVVQKRVVVFSGGSALNSAVLRLRRVIPNIAYVMTVSDDGGSSREIIRVLGGPSIGDIRSRLVRLARQQTLREFNIQRPYIKAVRALLNHRLCPATTTTTITGDSCGIPTQHKGAGSGLEHSTPHRPGNKQAREEFLAVVDGSHPLWAHIPEKIKQALRAFLVHFFTQVLQWESVPERPNWHSAPEDHATDSHNLDETGCVRQPDPLTTSAPASSRAPPHTFHFDFTNGSIGNFVLTGARLFFNSLEAAIHWFSKSCGVDPRSAVVPILRMNRRITIAAELYNPVASNTTILGQNNISHPPPSAGQASTVDKNMAGLQPMQAKVRRVFYIVDGREVHPPANPAVLQHISEARALVYSMGSLYTSIVPLLLARGMSRRVRQHKGPKIFILNGTSDRETTYRFRCDAVPYDYSNHNYDEPFVDNLDRFRKQREKLVSAANSTECVGAMRILDYLEAIVDAADGPARQNFHSASWNLSNRSVQENDANVRELDGDEASLKQAHMTRMQRLEKLLPGLVTHVLYVQGTSLIRPDDIRQLKRLGVRAVGVAPDKKIPRNLRYNVEDLIAKLAHLVSSETSSLSNNGSCGIQSDSVPAPKKMRRKAGPTID